MKLFSLLALIAGSICVIAMFKFAIDINKITREPIPWLGVSVVVIGILVLCLLAKK